MSTLLKTLELSDLEFHLLYASLRQLNASVIARYSIVRGIQVAPETGRHTVVKATRERVSLLMDKIEAAYKNATSYE